MTTSAAGSRPVGLAERVELTLPLGASVVVCSDLHLGPSPTAASEAVVADLAARLDVLTGAGAIVFAGDCFELLAGPDPSVGASLDAHPDLERAVAAFGRAEADRHVVVLAGDHDGPLERRVLHKFSESMQIESLWRYNQKFQPYWRPRYVVVDSLDYVASHGLAIADAEALTDIPLLGRLVGGG